MQSGSNMTGTDLCVNKPHYAAAAVRLWESETTTSTLPPARVRTCNLLEQVSVWQLWVKKVSPGHIWTTLYVTCLKLGQENPWTYLSASDLINDISSILWCNFKLGARSSAFGWGTTLQVERSWVRFPMVSLELFIGIILPAALWPWGWISL
jgi:hypothetical protein